MARQRRDEARRIGARIAELRERAHLTQAAAADRAKVAYRTYQTWEAGDATPRWQNYERLAKVFGVKVEDILGAQPIEAPSSTTERLERIEEGQTRIELALDDVSARLEQLVEVLAPQLLAGAAAELEDAVDQERRAARVRSA